MKASIQYCSDLHLEFDDNKAWIGQHPIQAKAPLLVMAGDIMPLRLIDINKDFFDQLSDQFEKVIWIPGNHEYYHDDISHYPDSFEERIRENVYLVNNRTMVHEGLKIICSTLWTHISEQNSWYIQRGMSDFRLIKHKGMPLRIETYNQLHQESVLFIKKELAVMTEACLVLSHHVPTFMHYPEKYKGDVLNEAFAVELHELIYKHPIAAWIFGHHHQAVPTFEIGGTQLLNNQLGYVSYQEHLGFDGEAVFGFS